MSIQEPKLYPITDFGNEHEGDLGFRELFRMYLYHWRLFALGIVVMTALSLAYIHTTIPVYNVKAKILLKNNDKTEKKEDILKELTLQTDNKLVENELEVLKSKALMARVVQRLTLNKKYAQGTGGGYKEYYRHSPVHLTYFKSHRDIGNTQLVIQPIDAQQYYLHVPRYGKQTLQFNKRYKNSLGEWELASNPNLLHHLNTKITITVLMPDQEAYNLSRKLEATHLNDQTSVIELSFTDNLPDRGKDILNTLILEYNKLNDIRKNQIAEKTLSFLNARLSTLTKELNQVEGDAAHYRSSNGLTDITSQSQAFLDNVQENDTRLKELDVQLAVLDGVERYVNSESSFDVPATLGLPDQGLSQLINEVTKLKLARENLLATTPEGNPIFETIDRQIRSLNESLKDNVSELKKSLLASKNQINTHNSKFESAIKRIPAQERHLVDIKRQQSIKEGLYVYLLQKQEELSLKYASADEDNQIVDKAYNDKKSWPNKPLIFGIAFIAGIFIPGGYLWGKNYFKNRIRTRLEIEKALALPIIGELIHEKTDSLPVINRNRNFVLGEQFRALRTSLRHMQGESNKGVVTLVTSSVAGEGKSFVSANLGAALAASNRRTVLLELDLRKPRLTQLFELHRQPVGISNLLLGQTDLNSVIVPVRDFPNLSIITCGTILTTPAELLERHDLGELIRKLRLLYDDIIIDTPPVHLVTDAIIIGRHVDTSLYIIRQGKTSKDEFTFIQQLKQQNLLPNIKLVFNGLVPKKYGYGYALDRTYYQDQLQLG